MILTVDLLYLLSNNNPGEDTMAPKQHTITEEEIKKFRKKYASVDSEFDNVTAERADLIKKGQDPYIHCTPQEAKKLMREEATRRYNYLQSL